MEIYVYVYIYIYKDSCTYFEPQLHPQVSHNSRMSPQFPGAGLLPRGRSAALHGEFTTSAADDAVAAGFCQVVLEGETITLVGC